MGATIHATGSLLARRCGEGPGSCMAILKHDGTLHHPTWDGAVWVQTANQTAKQTNKQRVYWLAVLLGPCPACPWPSFSCSQLGRVSCAKQKAWFPPSRTSDSDSCPSLVDFLLCMSWSHSAVCLRISICKWEVSLCLPLFLG